MAFTAWPDLWGIALAEPGSAEARATLFRVHVELFSEAPARDAETIRSFEAIALGFLPRVDLKTLVEAAHRLALCPDTPPAVLEFLTARCPETRDAVAALAPALPAAALDILLSSAAGRLLLARRQDLDEATLRRLLVLHDPALDAMLAGNAALHGSEAAFALLLDRARDHAGTARALLARADLAIADEAALYLAAAPERRAEIRTRMAATALYQRPSLPFRANAALTDRLLDCAAAGDVEDLEAHLTAGLGLPAGTEWRILKAGREELLALGLQALGIDEEDAARIGMTLHPALSHSVAAVSTLVHTMRAVTRPVALALVEAILNRPASQERAGRHEPFFDPAQRVPQRAPASRSSAEERARHAQKG